MSILTLVQYLIKEYFIYVMAIYTLIFIVAATLFVRYRTNRRRGGNAQPVQEEVKERKKMQISIAGNKLLFLNNKTLQPHAIEFLKAIASTSDVYIVTQVQS